MTEQTFLCVQPTYLDGFRCDISTCPLGRVRPDERCPALRDLRIHDIYERSLLLSCPHAAGAILPLMTSFRFQTRRLSAEALSPANQDLPSLQEPLPELSYLLDLQRASLHILSMRRYPMNARLVLLGIFLEDALDSISDGRGYQLGKIIKSYASPFFEARFHEALKISSLSRSPISISSSACCRHSPPRKPPPCRPHRSTACAAPTTSTRHPTSPVSGAPTASTAANGTA